MKKRKLLGLIPAWPPTRLQLLLVSTLMCNSLFLCYHSTLFCQLPPADSEFFKTDGIVVSQKKYSIVVNTRDGKLPIKITNQTKVELKLIRPKIDFENQKLVLELPISAADGNHLNNEKVKYDLPNPLHITVRFNHQDQMDKVMKSTVKRLVSYDLHGKVRIREQDKDLTSGELELTGNLIPGNSPDRLRLVVNGQAHEVLLGNRDARLQGFSILDLKPHEVEVFVTGTIEEGKYFADEVVFSPVGDPLTRETDGLPRCLFLGDTISFNYQRPLREALAGIVNLHHPPQNCRGSKNWTSIHRWLGNHELPGRGWDVISFNFGHWDDQLSKSEYQENLRKVIQELRKTKAKLIWVTSTPIDYGFNLPGQEGSLVPKEQRQAIMREAANAVGKVPGRMRLQNEWAAEVLQDFPEIETCDLWQVVKNGQESVYKDWWFNKTTTFEYPQSIPLGRTLAGYLLDAAGLSEKTINPTTAHLVQVEEISDKR